MQYACFAGHPSWFMVCCQALPCRAAPVLLCLHIHVQHIKQHTTSMVLCNAGMYACVCGSAAEMLWGHMYHFCCALVWICIEAVACPLQVCLCAPLFAAASVVGLSEIIVIVH